MIKTIHDMGNADDEFSLQELWTVLGGDGVLSAQGRTPASQADTIARLVRESCFGRGEVYEAERKALVALAASFDVNPARHPTSDGLEDAVVEAIIERVGDKIASMSEEERETFIADMLKRISDEDRVRMIEALLRTFKEMPTEEQDKIVEELTRELGVDEEVIRQAIAGGAAALIPLLLAKGSGFTVYLLSTKLMVSFFSLWGVVVPFGVYQGKNMALRALLGPYGMIAATALSAGWFAAGAWRRMTRFKKLVQIATYTSAWRNGRPAPEDLA